MRSWKGGTLSLLKLICLLTLAAVAHADHDHDHDLGHDKKRVGVTYDARSLIINGKRDLLFSGSIHYPRSTPEMWPTLVEKAKDGGLNVISTYVFWNAHEPVKGQYNFEGRHDLVRFIKVVRDQGLYVILRIGPFIQGEWNYGGLPCWLRQEKNMTFRTENKSYKQHMKKWTKKIVNMMKEEKLYASQGGPIILSQIENEYDTITLAFKDKGPSYVRWAAKMALSLDTGVPWVMCKQKDAPDPVINACNGRNCGDTFIGPNGPNKPIIWTENWTQQFRIFGDPPSLRSAEGIAYSVARFFSKNGTLMNYYMYHGGTNFGRTAATFVTPTYYDEAPLDEYGLPKDPKYSHLKHLHHALRLCKKPLIWGNSHVKNLGKGLEAIVYEGPEAGICAAFISNSDKRMPALVTFNGSKYYLPARSISILPDCKTVVMNTQQIIAQHNVRNYTPATESSKNLEWKMYQEKIPTIFDTSERSLELLEQINLTRDTTDYAWYTTSLELEEEDMPYRADVVPVIQVHSLGHAVHVFVNNIFIGSAHGGKIDKSFVFRRKAPLTTGVNHISLLSMTVGLPDSGVYLERRFAGIQYVIIQGLNTGTLDLSDNWWWGNKVAMEGERLNIYDPEEAEKVQWSGAKGSEENPLIWYKAYFDAPEGDQPVAVDMSSMSKGQIWVNGQGIGRYWLTFLNPLGQPTQSLYHIPRSFLKPKGNLLVIFEEIRGDPEKIIFATADRDTICSFVQEFQPPHVKSWERKDNVFQPVADDMKPHISLKCPKNKVIKDVDFASFGNPHGICGNFIEGNCHYNKTKDIVKKACLGKATCTIKVSSETFGGDRCPGVRKAIAAQVRCGYRN